MLTLLDVRPGFVHDLVGERFDIVTAAPWVDEACHARFFLEEELCVSCDTGGEVGRQGDGLVECVGVERLGMSTRSSHGFDAGPRHVIKRVLLGQRPTRSLRVGAECE